MIIKKTVVSVLELVPQAVADILRELSRAVSLPDQEKMDINLIVEELITNAIRHGNQYDTSKTVEVSVEYDDVETLVIIVKDQGKGFDPKQVPDLSVMNERMNSSGRGLFLLNKLAEEVKFNENGSEIYVRKKVHPRKK